ncbi:MAG: superoxide dismutase [Gemmataceae bacterium]
MLTRRDMLRTAAAGGAVLLTVPAAARAQDKKGGFTLPKLPYAYDALEPHIDARTMEIHHSKHHQAYVDNLNKALPGHTNEQLEEVLKNLKSLPAAQQTAVRNNGGGHWNHTFFWKIMSKDGGRPTGDLLKAIDASFGSLDGFKKEFKAKALAQFGSGWAWLVPGADKPLAILTAANQDTPVMNGGPAPILGIDVWEHAYYLKYQNKRADYVDAWFNVINWAMAAENFAKKG